MRVDWFAIIADLNRQGIHTNALDAYCGVTRHKASYYKQGGEPKHDDGERLIGLWIGITGKTREQLPVIKEQLSVTRARVLLKS